MKITHKKEEKIPWHPDFRDPTLLPDIKLVRTNFIYNFFAFIFTLSVFVFYFIAHWANTSMKTEVQSIEKELTKAESINKSYVEKNHYFNKESQLIKDFNAFMHPSIDSLQLITLSSVHKPEQVIFKNLNFEEVQSSSTQTFLKGEKRAKETKLLKGRTFKFVIEGAIKGSYDEALVTMNRFVDTLKTLPQLSNLLDNIEMASLRRDPKLNIFSFVINVTLRPQV